MKWDPKQYAKFSDHRDHPFHDLMARITAGDPQLVVDLGCGSGSQTYSLARRWPAARVIGLDSSAEMINQARATHQAPKLSYEIADATTWMPDPDTDVLVSNAMLQWIPEHRDLMDGWLDALAPGAWFGAQVPGNFGAPSHALMRKLADSRRWAPQLSGVLRHEDAVREPSDYQRLLLAAGYETDVWETTYGQVLIGPDPVLEWVRGTALRPVFDTLDTEESAVFESQYAELMAHAYPAIEDSRRGTLTLFPFRRIFMVGSKR